MLTKEFAAKVGLSEKQVRKIVQHLEDRGYQLSKTEYRGREATDFQEEDVELFQEIAEKVKETNSYDQAFDCLLYTSPSPRDGLLSRMPSSA